MANPFYPPKGARPDRADASRGSISRGADEAPIAFDPDRRGHWNGEQGGRRRDEANMPYDDDTMTNRPHVRRATEGPGAAAAFYVQDDIYGGGAQQDLSYGSPYPPFPSTHASYRLGVAHPNGHLYPTGHRGDGASPSSSPIASNATLLPRGQYNAGQNGATPFAQRYPEARYVYDDEQFDEDEAAFRAKEGQRRQAAAAGGFATHQPDFTSSSLALDTARLNQYPPPALSSVERPSTPGIYVDRPPRKEALNDRQREILATFPEDLDEEKGGLWTSAKKMAKNWRQWVQWRYTHYYIILIFICILVALMTIYHRQIIDWLTPVSKKINSVSWGWVIPVAILFVISFPPLFGHEIVGILCGVVYGLWIGFGILSLGTLLGEIGNFYAFKWFLRKHGEKYERKSLNYACMAHIVREGGFMVILLARLSAIPGHFTTAVFATVGMNFFVFTIAAILSLPKQLVVVYLGVAIEESGSGDESTQSKIIKWIVLIASFAVTILVAIYLYDKMNKARPLVQSRLRQRRYTLLSEAAPPKEQNMPQEAYSQRSHHNTTSTGSLGADADDIAETKVGMYGDLEMNATLRDDRDGQNMQRTPTIKFGRQNGDRVAQQQQQQQGAAPLQATRSILRKPEARVETPPSAESVSSHNHSPTRPLNYRQYAQAEQDTEASIRVITSKPSNQRYPDSPPRPIQEQSSMPRLANPYENLSRQQQQRLEEQQQQQHFGLKPQEPSASYQRVSGIGSVYELPPSEASASQESRRIGQDGGETSPIRPPSYHTDISSSPRQVENQLQQGQHQYQQEPHQQQHPQQFQQQFRQHPQHYHQQQRHSQLQQNTASTDSWNGGLAL